MSKPRPRARKKTAFVPRSVLGGAFLGMGVIPVCVAACGGKTSGGGPGILVSVANVMADSGPDGIGFTVACECFDSGAYDTSAPDVNQPDITFVVAAMGFDSSADAPEDAPPDVPLGVAADAFGGG